MKKSFVTVLSLAILTVGALAQAPSPAPAPEQGPRPDNHERMQARGGAAGGERRWAGPAGGMEGRELGMERIMGALAQNPELSQKLNLTAEQQAALKKISFAQRTKMVDLQAALQKAALKQADLLMADPLDEAALMTAVEDTSKARTDMAKAQIQNLIEIRKVLTEEQRKQLREMMTQMRQQPPMRPGAGRGPNAGRENAPPAPPPPLAPPPAPPAGP